MQLVKGQRFGSFDILGVMGRGGMASVYRAREAALGREVALKVLPAELVDQPGFSDRFEREARALARIEHDHVAPLYAFGIEQGVPWMSMRLLDGGSLEQRLRDGRMAPKELIDTLTGVGAALAAAHARGIVHRDVKPSNILFDSHGKAYLADFGISTGQDKSVDLTGSGVIGTPRYASPEQAMGLAVDARTDVYALGVVAFEALSGRPPFEGSSAFSVLKQHAEEPPPLTLLPDTLRSIVGRALAKEPNQRWSDAPEFVERLSSALMGTGPLSDTATTPIALQIPRRSGTEAVASGSTRSRARVGLIAGVLVATVAAIVTLLWMNALERKGARRPSRAATEPAVVVALPLKAVDAVATDVAFGTGVLDEALVLLDRMPRIRAVSARSAAADGRPVDDTDATHPTTHRIETSLQRTGETLRLTFDLIERHDGRRIWTHRSDFDNTLDLATQREAARDVMRGLRAMLDASDRYAPGYATSANSEALELFAQARAAHAQSRTGPALQLLTSAVEIDPTFVQAHALIAVLATWTDGSHATEQARSAAAEARRLNPNVPEVGIADGWVAEFLDGDHERALAAFDAVAAAAQHDRDLLRGRAFALRELGRFRESLEAFERLAAADPLDLNPVANVALLLQELHDYKRASGYLSQLAPDFPHAPFLGVWKLRADFLHDANAARLPMAIDAWAKSAGFDSDHQVPVSLQIQAAVLADDPIAALRLLEAYPGDALAWFGFPHLIASPSDLMTLRALLQVHSGRRDDAKLLLDVRQSAVAKQIQERPDDAKAKATLLFLRALAGQSIGSELTAAFEDARALPSNDQTRVKVLIEIAAAGAWSGERGLALDALELLIEEPMGVHAAQLMRDPLWSPLRAEPRLRRMLLAQGFEMQPTAPEAATAP